MIARLVTLIAAMTLLSQAMPAAQYSALWGTNGENWNARSRLPDFSFAGYHRGERTLPEAPPGRSVKDFGAKGDGVADDTQPFQQAIQAVKAGAIEVPPGRYKITGMLEVNRPNVVLRGAGADKTTLFFPTPLNDIKPNWGATTAGRRTSNYSWSGGLVSFNGGFGSAPLARITTAAKRGDTSVMVSRTTALRVGQAVELYQADKPDNSLAIHLYSGDAGAVEKLNGRTRASLICRIQRIEGKRAYLDRALRCDVNTDWRPSLRSFEPTTVDSGIEHLAFEFPAAPYKGHFTEMGYNAIALTGTANCWIRDIRIVNPDSGIFVSGPFNTVSDVVFESSREPDRQGCVGHHGISLSAGDNFVTRFDFRTRFIHDITVTHYCAGNVCSSGRGVDLSLDHHKYAPYENLFTDLDAGAGTRLWHCGGGDALGKHCGARGTFWNIRARQSLSYPPQEFGPASMNLVALESTRNSETKSDGKWFEAIKPADIVPQDLHQAQLSRRLGRSGQPTTSGAAEGSKE